jgi:hypothetical protein
VRRSMFAAVVVLASASSLLSQAALAQWWDLPDGIDNPRPRYYDYHPPGVFYGDAGPVGFAASGFVALPFAAIPLPAYGSAGYGYGSAYVAPPAAVPVAPRPPYGYVGPANATPPVAVPVAPRPPYGYVGPANVAPPVAVPVAPRPLCGVYRYWRDGICVDRRGY